MKRLSSLILAVALVFSLIAAPVRAAGPDAASTAPATRAMLCAALWQRAGKPIVNYILPFTDVSQSADYAEAVRWAAAEKLVSGTGDGLFRPDDALDREQLAVILHRCARYRGMDVSTGENAGILGRGDTPQWSDWAASALQWAVGSGLLSEKDGASGARDAVTQAEAAAVLERFDRLGAKPVGSGAEPVAPRKVIFDTDMAYLNDDAIAMFMLSQADRRKDLTLLGVTTVGGNVYAAEATTAALRQLELIGRADIPVYQGTDVPLAGFRDMEEETRLYGALDWYGTYWDFSTNSYSNPYARPTDYMNLGYEPQYGYPTTRPAEQTAWDFMIEQVHKYPGEVTIMAVGAATNVAIAIKKDPALVQDAAGIIYMGGDIDVPGNASAAAEFNWFYDPAAIRACLEAEWKSQLVVPDDLARQVYMKQSIYDRLRKQGNNEITRLTLTKEDSYDPQDTNYVWDVVVPAVFLKPEIMRDLQTRYLTVDDQSGFNSGRAVSWGKTRNNDPETGKGMPEGVRPVQILLSIDEAMFWDFYVDLLTWG